MIFLDTETTGFHPKYDDILSLAIISDSGETLFSEMFRPTRKTAWPEAMKVNQITPEMVSEKPTIQDRAYLIHSILDSEAICAYNADFDLGMLSGNGIKWKQWALSTHCAMNRWAIYKAVPSSKPYHTTGFRTFKLTEAAAEIEYQWTGRAHGAEADALACRAVWRYLDEVRAKR